MSLRSPASARSNGLLAPLSLGDRRQFLAASEMVELKRDDVLMRPDDRCAFAYFPLDAAVSLSIAPSGTRQHLEVALVAREGMVGLPLLLGSTISGLRATVVRPGAALRIAARPLNLQLRASQALAARLQRYVMVSLAQLAQAALCSRYHHVDARLARWLLMTHDRLQQEALHVTHEALAATLGVRRAGVTRAAVGLQQGQLITYRRGILKVLDRAGLQSASCACYAADRASYARLMRAPSAAGSC